MSNFLRSTLDDARRHGDYLHSLGQLAVKAGASSSPNPVSMIGATHAGIFGALNARQESNVHAEQFKHNSGRVYSVVKTVAQRCAGQEIKVALRKKNLNPKKPIAKDFLPDFLKGMASDLDIQEQHELLDVLKDPNPLMTGMALKLVTFSSLEITGKAFWWVVRPSKPNTVNPDGTPADEAKWQLWPIPPSWVEPKHAENRLYAAWEVRPPQATQAYTIPGDDMVYFYYPDPSDPMSALSPMQAQSRAVAADEAMADSQRKSFVNSLNPGLLISVGRHPDLATGVQQRPMLSEPQRNQIIGWVKAMYRGVDRFHEPLIMDALIENVERLDPMPRELDFLNSQKATTDRIDQGFGVPPVSMGRIENVNRAGSAVADQHFVANKIQPILTLFSESMTAWLGPIFAKPGEELVVYSEPATASDPEMELQKVNTMMKGSVIEANELRQAMGKPPLDELKDYLVGPTGLVPKPGSKAALDAEKKQREMQEAKRPPAPVAKPPKKSAAAMTKAATKAATPPAPIIVSPNYTINVATPDVKVDVRTPETKIEHNVTVQPADVKNEITVPVPSVTVENKNEITTPAPEVKVENHVTTPTPQVTVQSDPTFTVQVPELPTPQVTVHNTVSNFPALTEREVAARDDNGLVKKIRERNYGKDELPEGRK